MRKKIINKKDFPMVLNWDGYEHTRTRLPCKCQDCGCVVMKSINSLDKKNAPCRCVSCGIEVTKKKKKEKFNGDYSSVVEKFKQTCLEKYGTDNPLCLNEIQDRIKKTCLEKYGVEHPLKSDNIKSKLRKTSKKKYGTPHHAQRNREMWQIEITSSKEKFEEYLKSFNVKPTSVDLSKKLGFNDRSTICNYITKYDLWDYIDSHTSTDERKLSEYINSLGFKNRTKKIIGCGEIDIFIPDLNIGFEYNGSYWHSDSKVDKNYHYDKTTCCDNEGIRLIHIFEHEWINNQDKIKSYIKAQLGLCEKRIFARKCQVKEIDFKTAKPLLEYHQQKSTTAQHYIGLYHENELVLVMLFGRIPKGIFTKNPIAEWEIKREICKEGYSVVGGKSKVFKYFVRTYKPQSVASYVDRAKFTGKSYQIMGFKLDHINGARYDWVYKYSLIFKKRQPCIYKQMMKLYKEGKALRIYDAGRFCYIWEKNG
jgi:hypothetical protein